MDKIIKEFPITVYGNLEKFNQTISKARCRIFYKYGNRNGTYITDEFAEKLIASLPYTPVKGIYNGEDYTDHGQERDMGRIYGIVPENPNVAWETHLDDDGIERTYACCDVYVYTALYGEANEILDKSQSMELYEKSIVGDWQIVEGKKYFVFKDGCFLGLQVLGDVVEPCFEGAAFYTLLDTVKRLLNELNFQKQNEGGKPMLNFKLSDDQKYNGIWNLINTNCTEEKGWVVDYSICAVYDEYAVIVNNATNAFERVYYKKNDENDSIELGERVPCFIVDVTESEKKTLDAIQALNGGNFEKAEEVYARVENLEKEKAKAEQKIVEFTENISTLTKDNETLTAEFEVVKAESAEKDVTISSLQEEKEALATFKKNVERDRKLAVINTYESLLSGEELQKFIDNVDTYQDETTLDMELTYALKKTNPSIFNQKTTSSMFIPKPETTPKTGIAAILDKYKKD